MRLLTLLFLSFLFVGVSAQKDYSPKGKSFSKKRSKYRTGSAMLKRRPTDVFPLDPEFRLSGWVGSLGATYMVPMSKGEGGARVESPGVDTTWIQDSKFEGKPGGSPGIYASIGYFKSFANPGLFHFFDITLGYKQFKGKEELNGQTITKRSVNGSFPENVNTETITQTSSYSDNLISLSSSLTNHWHFSRYGFLQNSLGLNVDYFVSTSRDAAPVFPGYDPQEPEDLLVQLHYRFGVGWKASPTILVVPSLELPLITAFPFENGKSSLPYYSTRQYPIIVSVRIMFLRRLSEDCVVPQYDGPTNFQ